MKRAGIVASAVLLLLIASAPARADGNSASGDEATAAQRKKSKPRDERQPALIAADQISQDRDLDIVTASGHVEIDQGGRTLLADAVSYNLKQDVIVATGHVVLNEATGDVTFADYFELTGDFKEATARHLRLLMIDNSRLVAATAQRVDGDRNILNHAMYTACEPCAKDPDHPPLWDIRATQIVHDDTTHEIVYHDAWFEADGVPVAYSPYFEHGDATVKRESGILAPSFVNNRIIGTGIRTPYYQVISPSQDLLFEPMYTTNEGVGAAGDWRARSQVGEATTVFSVADEPEIDDPSVRTTGWDVSATSRFAIDDTWRAGYDIQRASDRDYMRYYDYNVTQPFLTARPFVEAFGERNYASIEAYSFQSQGDTQISPPPGVPDKTPTVLPLITYGAQTAPGANGDYWTFDTHSASLTRSDDETNTRRVNTLTAWHMPYTAADGEVLNGTVSLRGDAYNSDHVVGLDTTGTVDAERAVPQASLDWRYPLAKYDEHDTQTLTPIVMANVGAYSGNNPNIPNEDSLDFELDDANIFSPNPSPGYDRIASAPRLAYGGEYNLVNRGDEGLDFLLGQSYQPHAEDVFPTGTGLDGHLSDIVGRAEVTPSSDLHFDYRYRLGKDDLAMERSEVDASVGPRPLNAQIGYVFFARTSPESTFAQREQIIGTISGQIDRHWSAQIYDNQDLGIGAGPLQTGGRIGYEDECLALYLDAGERHTVINTVTAGHYVVLSVVLKSLAQFPVDLY